MRMDESRSSEVEPPPQTEDGPLLIERLLASDAYHAIHNLIPNVNCFEILDTAVAPESWIKFLGFLFDSRAEHALGQRFFRAWLDCLELKGWEQARPFMAALPPVEATYTRVHKYWWGEGRFLETLVEVVGKDDRVLAVLGIKNKHGSGDDHDELQDLQRHLLSTFPSVPKLIVAVEGYQREKMDFQGEMLVPVIHQSVRTLVNAAMRMDGVADATVDWLLACLIEYLEKRLLGVNRMSNQARQLVRELYANTEHRAALRHICRFTPTLRSVYDRMQVRMKQAIAAIPKQSAPQGSVIFSYFPPDHISPKEMKIEFIELNFRSERHGAWVVYVLDANSAETGPRRRDHAAHHGLVERRKRQEADRRHEPQEPPARYAGAARGLVELGADLGRKEPPSNRSGRPGCGCAERGRCRRGAQDLRHDSRTHVRRDKGMSVRRRRYS